MKAVLRPELLRASRADGGIDLYDPLLERLHALTASDLLALESEDPALLRRLEAACLLEGPAAVRLRQAVLAARRAAPPLPAPTTGVAAAPWEQAQTLPSLIDSAWRSGEIWRRTAEDRAAGQRWILLRGLLNPGFADALAAQVAALAFTRFETALVRADRAAFAEVGALGQLAALLVSEPLRALAGAVLGVDLPASLQANVWRLHPGDHFGVHPDGRRYRATFALGLNSGWTAEDGGAIAWGEPTEWGLRVEGRWLPHRGDALIFAPDAQTWHQVEPPRRTRLTLSGWWTDPSPSAPSPGSA